MNLLRVGMYGTHSTIRPLINCHIQYVRVMMRGVTMAPSIRHNRMSLVFAGLGFLVAIAVSAGLVYGIRHILDSYTISHADPAMIALATQAGMSREGELVFLRAHPQFVSDTQMQSACAGNTAANNSNGFIEQGCYVTGTHRIYLRHMPSNLYQLEVSTAAYEMLHPLYISLTSDSKASAVNIAIEANYTKLKDVDLEAQVANFAKTEPGARDLELFSLLGTGYAAISPALVRYYAPYFTNLGATVTASTQVKQLFRQNENQLAQLRAQVSSDDTLARNAYTASVMRAHAGDQAGDEYYYNSYQEYLDQENTAIAQYNVLLVSYNALVTEYNGTQPVRQINPALTQLQ
jgi:hypothetical protein